MHKSDQLCLAPVRVPSVAYPSKSMHFKGFTTCSESVIPRMLSSILKLVKSMCSWSMFHKRDDILNAEDLEHSIHLD